MMNLMNALFLQAGVDNAGILNLVFIAAIFIVFYFFLIRPQSKRQKEQKNFIDELSKGDEVVTAGGILGKITKIEDDIVTLEIGSKSYIRVLKTVVSKDMTEGLGKKE